MTLAVETVYSGHDNAIEFILKEEGVAIDHTNITRLQVMNVSNDNTMTVIADSQMHSTSFIFRTANLSMRLGNMGIPVGEYYCRLNVFSIDAPNGVIWSPAFPMVVV